MHRLPKMKKKTRITWNIFLPESLPSRHFHVYAVLLILLLIILLFLFLLLLSLIFLRAIAQQKSLVSVSQLYRILCVVVCLFSPMPTIDELNAKEIQFKRIFFILSHIMAFFVVSCFCVHCNENKYVCVFVLLLECNSISISRKWTDK